MPPGEWAFEHNRAEYSSAAGVIGARVAKPRGATWYNHMSARNIRNRLGADVWERYFKFTVVRNPFDKLISGFFMFNPRARDTEDLDQHINEFRLWLRCFHDVVLTNKALIEDDRTPHYLKPLECSLLDRDKYLIDGAICVDRFIRFENLQSDVRQICVDLDIPFDASKIPSLKQGLRQHRARVTDYFDHECEQLVRDLYHWELNHFGYDLHETF